MDVNTDPPTLEEMKMAITLMKNGKTPGSDEVTAEMLNVEDTVTPRLLTDLQCHLGNRKQARGLENGADNKITQKGRLIQLQQLKRYHLLSLTSKVFSKVIQERLTIALEQYAREELAGFMKGESCSDHIYTLRQILEQSKEWNTPLYTYTLNF